MEALHEYMREYQKQLEKGAIQKAYRGLMDYMLGLRNDWKARYPQYAVSGNMYFGYMDMTYLSLFPEALKPRSLKIAIVFLHEAFRFEVWLAGVNKQVQARYWKLVKDSDWRKYRLVDSPQGNDSILEHILADQPDFCDLDALSRQIEAGTLAFIQDVERFLTEQEPD